MPQPAAFPDQPAGAIGFGLATPAELPAAFQLLFNRLDETARPLQIAAAQEEMERTGGEGQILFVARRSTAVVAAVWVQIMPGGVASLWAPGLTPGESAATAATIVDLVTAKAALAGVRLIQALLETDSGPPAAWLRQSGFKYTADLLYLVSTREKFPTSPPPSELIFESLGESASNLATTGSEFFFPPASMSRLASIIKHTYVNTQDCPAIQGIRPVENVLATYRAVGTFNPASWFVVRHNKADVGCLLLADHPQHLHCELVYMGLIPAARGHGWGVEVVRFAQWQATQTHYSGKSAERMVLAVDAANSPAISMYAAAGFETWDRRSVFLREIPERNSLR